MLDNSSTKTIFYVPVFCTSGYCQHVLKGVAASLTNFSQKLQHIGDKYDVTFLIMLI